MYALVWEMPVDVGHPLAERLAQTFEHAFELLAVGTEVVAVDDHDVLTAPGIAAANVVATRFIHA